MGKRITHPSTYSQNALWNARALYLGAHEIEGALPNLKLAGILHFLEGIELVG